MVRISFLAFLIILLGCGSNPNTEGIENEDRVGGSSDDLVSEVPSKLYVATVSGMNLREDPSTSGKKIKLLSGGTVVTFIEASGVQETISGFEGEWLKVDADGEVGYVFGGYVTKFELPPLNEQQKIAWFFNENFVRDGNEIVLKMVWSEDGNSRTGTPVKGKAAIKIEEESDFFEIRQSYMQGSYFVEEIGYEYNGKRGYIPGVSLQEAFLIARWLVTRLESGTCKYELKDVGFTQSNSTIKTSTECSLEIVVEKRGNEIQKMLINANDDFLYTGLELMVQKGGVEFKVYTAL